MTTRTPIEIETEDGVTLRGEARPGGALWAVLAHAQGGDLDEWRDLPELLAGIGIGVIALDLRGHGGSDGEPSRENALRDVEAGIRAAREGGAAIVAVVAADETATVALDRSSAEAVVAITPTTSEVEPDERRPPMRLLIVTQSPAAVSAAAELQAQPGRRTFIARVPLQDTGLSLLTSAWASNIASYVCAFVRQVGLELARHSGHFDDNQDGGDQRRWTPT
jgi:pimeloyl-ACP methyl ester carboxylesterase